MEKHGWMVWTILPLFVAGLWWLVQSPQVDVTHPGMGFVGNERSVSSDPVPSRAELAGLQNKADAACRCDRTQRVPWGERCWADYRRSVARFAPSGSDTMCAEESVSMDCFGPDGPNRLCVSTGRAYGACSDTEERARIAAARRRQSSGCQG
jgi:hypothetical protein